MSTARPSRLQNILTLLSIFIITWRKSWREKKAITAVLKLFTHADDERRAECSRKTLLCVFSFSLATSITLSGTAAQSGSGTKQLLISGAAVAFYGWSKVREMIKYKYSLFFLYPRIHSALACIINAKDWEVWKWINGKDKKWRDGESKKRKNNVEGSNTSERGREKSHGEWRDCVRLAWHLLNISITDWVAIKMLLIQTPKDFYKTSISLSWLQHRGIHHGK